MSSDPPPQPATPARDLLPVQPSRRSRLSRGNNAASSSSSTARRAADPPTGESEEAAENLPAAEEETPTIAADAEQEANALLPTTDDEASQSPEAAEPEPETPREEAPAPPPPRPRPIPSATRNLREPMPASAQEAASAAAADSVPDFEPAGGFPLTFRERFLSPGDLPSDVIPMPTLPAQTPGAASSRRTWSLALIALAFVLAGGVAGFFVGRYANGAAPAGNPTERSSTSNGNATTSSEQPSAAALAEVEAAFTAASAGNYATARTAFETTEKRYPNWPTLAIERARNTALIGDLTTADAVLQKLLDRVAAQPVRNGISAPLVADANFLRALLHVRAGEQDLAIAEFGRAVAADPTRAEPFFFWGHVLRRAGKPGESIEKLRAAVRRNQMEGNRGMYQAELWLSQLEVGGDEAALANTQIDAASTQPIPSGAAWIGLAARALRAGKYDDAAGDLRRARSALDPAIYQFFLTDPLFVAENWRPEMAELFR